MLSEGQPTLRRRRVRHRLPIQRQRLLRLIRGQLRQTQLLMHHHHLTTQSLANRCKRRGLNPRLFFEN
tara:strand:- start:428 stop:631 length:204 start_codon:yes stop_codon:yes gene_type:complete